MAYVAYYRPQREQRQAVLVPGQSALLFVDVQNYNCSKQGAMYAAVAAEDLQGPQYSYFFERVGACTLKWQHLQQLCRAAGIEVIYTVIQSLTRDGRDRGLVRQAASARPLRRGRARSASSRAP